jgi:predicted DNA binding CopG/RHH family protein
MAKNVNSFSVAKGLFWEGENTSPNEPIEKKENSLKETTTPFAATQGRKGAKVRRMNVPVTDEEYEAIRRGSRAAGMTYGEYIYAAVAFYQANSGNKS